MFGGAQGSLHTDLIVNGVLIEDVIPVVLGDQGNVWNLASINLTNYLGDTVILRIRGRTGSSFESDLALDDFTLQTVNTPPSAS